MRKIYGIVAILSATVMWGLSYPLIKMLLEEGAPPIMLAMLRHLIFLPMLIVLMFRKRKISYSKQVWLIFILLAIFTIFIPNLTQNIGMKYTTASVAGIVQSTSPIFTIILAILLLKETKTLNKLVGSSIAMIGTVFLVSNGRFESDPSTFGNFLILISSISYAISGIILKKALTKIPPFDLLCFETTFGFFMLLGAALVAEDVKVLYSFDINTWLLIVVLSISASFVAALLYYMVLVDTELSTLIVFTYMIPIFDVIFSYFLLREILTPFMIVCATVVIGGIFLAQIKSQNGPARA